MKGTSHAGAEAAIIGVLRDRGRAERRDLTGTTGLSPATVSRALGRLRRDGYVAEVPSERGGVGRPPRLVQLRSDRAYVVAVDAGGSMLRVALADLEGVVRDRLARPAGDTADAGRLIADIVSLVGAVTPAAHGRPVLGLVAGVSGIVDHWAGRVLASPDLPGLAGVELARELEGRLGIPCAIDNDDLLAAIGEASVGAARGCRDVAFLSLGYGLGAGLIVDGRPIHGASSAAGAITYLGRAGLAEHASGRGIARRFAAARVAASQRRPDASEAVDARGVFELAAGGDSIARAVVQDAVAAMAELVTDVAALVDPEIIVLGGGLVGNGSMVFEPIVAHLSAALPYPPRVVASSLGDSAVIAGGVAVALARSGDRLRDVVAAIRPGVREVAGRPPGPAVSMVRTLELS